MEHGFAVLPERRTTVAIVGGGIAGLWTAYQLARAGIRSVVLSYAQSDRGGIQGASRRSAGAINVAPLGVEDLELYLQELGRGQVHTHSADILGAHLDEALADLSELIDLTPIKIGYRLAHGPGQRLLHRLAEMYENLGGVILDAWVTRLVADSAGCRGVQYETPLGIGKVRARHVVLACGGYAGLLGNATRTNCFGALLGRFLAVGGVLTNLEFVFKHGYGDIDANSLTPTEDLPGSEIHAADGERVLWLEQILFDQLGTHSHLQATGFWSRNAGTTFRVDRAHRGLYLKLWRLKQVLEQPGGADLAEVELARQSLVVAFPEHARSAVTRELGSRPVLDFALFERLKAWSPREANAVFRVAPLTYFTMGGVAHSELRTNLPGVFVIGEAMHDFGANRVGGLPWGLYLAAGYRLRDHLLDPRASRGKAPETIAPPALPGVDQGPDFDLVPKRCVFDAALLSSLQSRLGAVLEGGLPLDKTFVTLGSLREERRALKTRPDVLHDSEALLLLAEAILESALCRHESRGFFYRSDHPDENPQLYSLHSRAEYDETRGEVRARLCPADELALECASSWRKPVPQSAAEIA